MNAQEEYLQLKSNWRRRIVATYYVVAGIISVAEIAMFLFMVVLSETQDMDTSYVGIKYVLFPVCINFLSIWLAQTILKKCHSEAVKDWAVVGSLMVICVVVGLVHSSFLIAPAAFVAPVIVSCILDNKQITKLSSICCACLLLLTVWLSPVFDDVNTDVSRWQNALAGLVILLVVSDICLSLCDYTEDKNDIIYHTSLSQERMHAALKMDSMTRLFNHSEFYHCMDESILWSQSHHRQVSVAVIDVDFFKSVNDTYGHENGDTVLIRLAEILKDNCPKEGKAFRYGGEEFGLIINGYTKEQTYELMESIRHQIYQEKFSFMPERHLSISTGIYEYQGDDMDGEEIFKKADLAMYEAKQNGRNRTICSA